MITVLSPAMNMVPVNRPELPKTQPVFNTQSMELIEKLKEYSSWELEALLDINPQQALRVADDYQRFGTVQSQALLSFHGLAFQSMNPADFSAAELRYAQDHLRILSALYGILRPLDGISAYRLDFVCPFGRQKKLYAQWSDRICRALLESVEPIINLCSGEYEKLVKPYLSCSDPWITCRFLVYSKGRLRCQATASKMARGRMAREIVQNRWESPEQLTVFNWDGYRFSQKLSDQKQLTFVREP